MRVVVMGSAGAVGMVEMSLCREVDLILGHCLGEGAVEKVDKALGRRFWNRKWNLGCGHD